MLAMKKTWSMLALTAVLTVGAADVASASSIVFTKGGNVWRSSLDGHNRQLTRDGGCEYALPGTTGARLRGTARTFSAPIAHRLAYRVRPSTPPSVAAAT